MGLDGYYSKEVVSASWKLFKSQYLIFDQWMNSNVWSRSVSFTVALFYKKLYKDLGTYIEMQFLHL